MAKKYTVADIEKILENDRKNRASGKLRTSEYNGVIDEPDIARENAARERVLAARLAGSSPAQLTDTAKRTNDNDRVKSLIAERVGSLQEKYNTQEIAREQRSKAQTKVSPDQRSSMWRQAEADYTISQARKRDYAQETSAVRMELLKRMDAQALAEQIRREDQSVTGLLSLDEDTARLEAVRQQRDMIQKRLNAAKQDMTANYYGSFANDPDFMRFAEEGRNANTDDPSWRLVNGLPLPGGSLPNINYDHHAAMSQREKDTYNYLYAKNGEEAANKYLDDLTPALMERRSEANAARVSDVATNMGARGAIAAAVYSVLQSPYAGAAYFSSLADTAAGRTPDTNGYTWDSVNQKNAIRSAQSEKIKQDVKQKTGSDFVANGASMIYSAFMSTLDSQYTGLLLGQPAYSFGAEMYGAEAGKALAQLTTLGTMGAESAASSYKEFVDQGIDPETAMKAATVRGIEEALFEVASLDKAIDTRNAAAVNSWIKNLLIQSGIEGSEEFFTKISNDLTDAVILKEKSEFWKNVRQREANGETESAAINRTVLQMLGNAGLAFAGGSLGGLFGSAGDTVIGNFNQASYGRAIRQGDSGSGVSIAQALIEDSLASEDRDVVNLAKELQADESKRTDINLGRLARGLFETGNPTKNLDEAESARRVEAYLREAMAKADEAEKKPASSPAPGIARDSSGERVDVKGINSITDGIALLDVEDGILPADELTFDDEELGDVYRQAGRMTSVKAANAFVEGYDAASSATPTQYYQAFDSVVKAAQAGVSEQEIRDNSLLAQNWLTPRQLSAAYAVGAADYHQNVTAVKNAKAGLNMSLLNRQNLTPEARANLRAGRRQLDLINAVATKYGAKVFLVDTLKGKQVGNAVLNSEANGAYDPGTNTIYIAADAQEGALAYVAYHELTHMVKAQAKDAYTLLENTVRAALKAQGEDIDALIAKQKEIKPSLSYDGALEEVIANTVPTILTDESYLNRMLDEDPKGFAKIRRFIGELLETLRDAFFGLTDSASWRQDRELSRHMDELQKIEAAMDAALEASKGRTQTSTEEVKLSVRDEFYDEYDKWVENGRKLNEYVVVGDTPDVLVNLGATKKETRITGYAIDHMRNHDGISDAVIKKVPYALENPILVLEPDMKDKNIVNSRSQSVAIYTDILNDNGDPVLVVFTFRYYSDAGYVIDDAQFITNAYYKNKKIQKAIWEKNVLYINENKEIANRWLNRIGLQLPSAAENYGYIGSITETEEKVNISGGIPYKNLAGYPDTNEPPAIDDTEQDADLSAENDVEVTNDLIAVHNLSGEQLQGIIDLGGFPMPSIAVIRANQGHDRYGDVSVIFGRETIDPNTTPRNKVYGGDAWTPTFPRIEYEADQKAAKRIRDKYLDLSKRLGYEFTRPMYRLYSEPDEMLRSAGGETALVKKLADDTDIMQIFLADSGRTPVDTVIKEEVSRLDDSSIELYNYLAEALGSDTIKEVSAANGESPIVARKRWIEAHGDALESAIAEYWRQNGIPEEDITALLEATTTKEMLRDYIIPTRNYLRDGAEKRTQTIDTEATKAAIRNATNQEEYIKWLHKLLDGLEGKRGIYNGKDRYTSSGNQRSFNALHYEVTLENIVRAMRNEDAKGGTSFTAASGLFGLATKDYNSIDEIKADVKRLRLENAEEYEAAKKEYSDRLIEIADEIKPPTEKNSFIALDEASEALLDAVRRGKTKAGISRILNREYNGYYAIKPDTAQKIYDLVEDIKEMPTEYFEAKPERAVGLDEIKAIVMPEGKYEEQSALLSDNGVPVVRYDPNVEGDRIRALNSDPVQDVRFSVKDVTPVDTEKLQRENDRLKAALAHSNRQLRVTKGLEPEERVVRGVAKKLLKEYSSKYDLDRLTNELMQIYTFAAAGESNETRFDDINAVALGVMRKVIEQSEEKDTTVSDSLSGVRDIMKAGIRLNDEQRRELLEMFGTMANFRRETRGAVRITDKGTPLEIAWGEMRDEAPWAFDTDGDDMVATLAQVATMTSPEIVNPYGYDLDAAAADLWLSAQAEYGEAMKKSATYADKAGNKALADSIHYERQIAELKADIKALREASKTEIAEYTTQVKAELNEERKSWNAEMNRRVLKSASTARSNAIQKVKAMYRNKKLISSQNRREAQQRSSAKASILASTKTLMNYMRGNKVLDPLQEPVLAVIEAISNPSRAGTKAAAKWADAVNRLKTGVKEAQSAYADNGSNIEISDAVISRIEGLADTIGKEKNLRELTTGEMIQLKEIMKALRHEVLAANKLFFQNKRESLVQAGESFIKESRGKRAVFKKAGNKTIGGRAVEYIAIRNATPASFFETIGGPFNDVFKDMTEGQKQYSLRYHAAQEFYKNAVDKYNVMDWIMPKKGNVLTLTTVEGERITLTRNQAMYIYEANRRESRNAQENPDKATNHLRGGGIMFGDSKWTEDESGRVSKSRNDDNTHYKLSDPDIKTITDWLTKEQKDFADALVQYGSTVLSGYGNATSLRLDGIKIFTEPNYISFTVDDTTTADKDLSQNKPDKKTAVQVTRLKNAGMTKALTAGASNAIVLQDLTDVISNHTVQMLQYSTMAIPQDNLFKLLNYQRRGQMVAEMGQAYVKNSMSVTYSRESVQYINNFLRDLSGNMVSDSRNTITGRMLSRFKKGSVLGSLSVAIQQISALPRAFPYIESRFFFGKIKNPKAQYSECMKYSGAAGIKEIGGFDMGNSRGAAAQLMNIGADTKLRRTGDKMDDALGSLPESADMVAWAHIWMAAKRKAQAEGLVWGTEEHLTRAGEIFDDCINHTQVYDSVLTRSDIMRSNDTLTKTMTAFMAEPTMNLNMLVNSVIRAKDGTGKKGQVAKNMAALVLSVILNIALKSLVYAARDDDDTDTYGEKYKAQFLESLTGDKTSLPFIGDVGNTILGWVVSSDLSVATMIPFVKDAAEIFAGYDVERSDLNAVAGLYDALKGLGSESKTTYAKWRDFIGSLAAFAGVPVKNVTRDAEAIARLFGAKITDSTKVSSANAKYQKIVDLLLSDNRSRFARVDEIRAGLMDPRYSNAKTARDIDAGIAKALSETDPRIAQAYELRTAGDISGLEKLREEIIAAGFGEEVVDKAISDYANKIEKEQEPQNEDKPDEALKSRLYDYDNLFTVADLALDSGDYTDLQNVYDTVISDSDAKDPESTVRSKAVTQYKDSYLAAIEDKDTETAEELKKMLTTVFKVKEDTINGWVSSKHKDELYTMMSDTSTALLTPQLNGKLKQLRQDGLEEDSIKSAITSKAKEMLREAKESKDTKKYNRIVASLKALNLTDKKGYPYYTDEKIRGWFSETKK